MNLAKQLILEKKSEKRPSLNLQPHKVLQAMHRMSKIEIAAVTTSFFVLAFPTGYAQEQKKEVYTYSVKVVCGLNKYGANGTGAKAVAGGYVTDVNIHNAVGLNADITVVPAVAYSPYAHFPAPVGTSETFSLRPHEAMHFSCSYFEKSLNLPLLRYFDGFLTIASFKPLSVVGVYTAKHCVNTIGSRFLGNAICDGDVALDVVPYDPISVEPLGGGEPSAESPKDES